MLVGELSALAASILWSFSPYIFSAVVSKIGSFNLNLTRTFVSSILLVVTCVVLKISLNPTIIQLFYLSLSGIVGLVLGDTYLFKALKEIGPRYTMILMASNPAFGAIIAYFAFKENISLVGILGMLITFIGIYLVVYQQNEKEVTKFKITRKGIIHGLLSAVGQAVGLVLTKYAFFLGEINPLAATFYRVFPAFVALLLMAIFTKRLNAMFLQRLLEKRNISLLLLGSFIGPYLGISFSFIAVTHIQVGIAATIMSLQPILMLPISK
ncbi:MAG: DMT family transporter, partial [Candidatus Kapaibacteriota bacterium]